MKNQVMAFAARSVAVHVWILGLLAVLGFIFGNTLSAILIGACLVLVVINMNKEKAENESWAEKLQGKTVQPLGVVVALAFATLMGISTIIQVILVIALVLGAILAAVYYLGDDDTREEMRRHRDELRERARRH
jgi:hypothetical protein